MFNLINLQKFMNHPIQFLDEKFQSGGELQTVLIGPKRFHLVFDPNLAQEILIKHGDVFVQNRRIFDRIKPITGEEGLVQLNGEASRNIRRKVRPMLSPSNLEQLKVIVRENTDHAIHKITNNEVNITKFMTDLVLKNAFQMFLGIGPDEKLETIVSEFRELNRLCGKRMVALLPLPNPKIKKLRNSLRENIVLILKNKAPGIVNIHEIFQNDRTLIDQCMTFLFAGHETTASSLIFTLLLLGKYPEYQNEMTEDKALRIYKESLRLYPPAYMLAREVSQDIQLNGVSMRKGDQVLIGVKQIHRHPDYYSNPDEFRPERFHDEVKAFLPFGLGSKNCIGEKVAYMEAITIIQLFVKAFEFNSLEQTINSIPLVTLHPALNSKLQVKVRHG